MTLLQSNLAVLSAREPSLCERLFSSISIDEQLQIIPTPSGHPSALYHGNLVHSRRDPQREADKFVARWESPVPKVLILEGFGLGYQARSFLSAYPELTIWVIEPDIRMHYSILAAVDLRDLLNHPRLLFFYAPKPQDLGILAAETGHSSFGIAKIRSVYETNQVVFEKIESEIKSVIARRKVNENTLNRFGRLWIRNLIKNLPRLPDIKGLHRLENRFKGKPALLIAAGPSLEEIMPFLRELREKMVIVCVDTAVPLLALEGIHPDFVTVVDAQYWNTRHIDGQDLSRMILIAESSVHPRILRSRPRDVYFSASHFPLAQFLEKGSDIGGRLSAGGSVATAAWETCRYLGCTEIFCAGLDLGFPGGQTHHRNSFFEMSALCMGNRCLPLETSSFKALYDAGPFPVPDNRGGTTLSDQRMEVYIKWFENQMIRYPKIITRNLSSRGTRINGMERVDLTFLDRYKSAREEIDQSLSLFCNERIPLSEERKDQFKQRILSLRAEFKETEELGLKGLTLTDRFEDNLKNKLPIHRLLPLMDELDREILDSSVKNMAGFLFQDVISRINGSSENTAVENSRTIYTEILKASRFHLDLLTDSFRQINQED